jgi:hypothetical protein
VNCTVISMPALSRGKAGGCQHPFKRADMAARFATPPSCAIVSGDTPTMQIATITVSQRMGCAHLISEAT